MALTEVYDIQTKHKYLFDPQSAKTGECISQPGSQDNAVDSLLQNELH